MSAVRIPLYQVDAFTTRRLAGERVELEGGCVFYLQGEVTLEDGRT